jgi:hypothetical protein
LKVLNFAMAPAGADGITDHFASLAGRFEI